MEIVKALTLSEVATPALASMADLASTMRLRFFDCRHRLAHTSLEVSQALNPALRNPSMKSSISSVVW